MQYQQNPPKNYYGQCSLKFVWHLLHNFTGVFCVWVKAVRNLSPNIHVQILQTDLYIYFLKKWVERIWSKIKPFFLRCMDSVGRKLMLVTIGTWTVKRSTFCVWGYLKLLRSVPWSAVVRRRWLCCGVVRCTHQGLSLRNLLQLWITG